MENTLFQNIQVVNEGHIQRADILIEGEFIVKIAAPHSIDAQKEWHVLDGSDLHLLPGLIDDQVHFREPGLTHKGDLTTESRAAVAGGITSYMEMPNTSPPATTLELLEQKYTRAAEVSMANYSFFMGTSNTNLNELLKVDPTAVCGVKIFMGSSTGEMLVDNPESLENIFSQVKTLIAVHCEDDPMIKKNLEKFKTEYGDDIPVKYHPQIRNADVCYASSSFAVSLAKKHGTRLHILHISTEKELELFDNTKPLKDKKITAEACVHHLWFSDADYETKGNYIKWNPAIKSATDRKAIRAAVNDDRIDVIATDHAPHTIEEKQQVYTKAPSGGPLVQHSLVALLEMYHQGVFSLETIVQKTAHNVADMFSVDRRGYIREGYYADLVVVNLNDPWQVTKENILAKCQWSPFENLEFKSRVMQTFVNGVCVYDKGTLIDKPAGKRLMFNRTNS